MQDIVENAMYLVAIFMIVVIPILATLGVADVIKDWILKRNKD